MFLNIVLVVLGLTILCFAFYGIYLYKRKRKRFEELKSIIEFVSFFLSALFDIITILQTSIAVQSSQEDSTQLFHKIDSVITSANNAKDVLDSVSQKLKPLPVQLDKFAESIAKLNSVIGTQQERFVGNINDLDQSVGTLTASLKDYRNYINDYSGQLKTIVSQTDTLLKIWKDQQEIIKKEYSRKPELNLQIQKFIDKGSAVDLENLLIHNDGNIKATITGIILFVPQEYKVSGETPDSWKVIRTIDGFNVYQFTIYGLSNIIVTSNASNVISFTIKNYNKEKSPRLIDYSLFYESNYVDGVIRKKITLY